MNANNANTFGNSKAEYRKSKIQNKEIIIHRWPQIKEFRDIVSLTKLAENKGTFDVGLR